MPERSAVYKLPEGLKARIEAWLADGGRTLEEILALLAETAEANGCAVERHANARGGLSSLSIAPAGGGEPIGLSHSGLHRFAQRYEKELAEVGREIRMAAAWGKAAGQDLAEAGAIDVIEPLAQSMQSLILRCRLLMTDDAELSPKKVRELCDALVKVTSALGQTQRIRAEAEAQARAKLREEQRAAIEQAKGDGRIDAAALEEAMQLLGLG